MIISVDTKFGRNEIQSMIDDLKPLVEDEQLNHWEMNFVKNIMTLCETDVPITVAQEDKLKEIWEEYVS